MDAELKTLLTNMLARLEAIEQALNRPKTLAEQVQEMQRYQSPSVAPQPWPYSAPYYTSPPVYLWSGH